MDSIFVKTNKVYDRIGALLFVFGAVEIVFSNSSCLMADGFLNMFAGYYLWSLMWATSIESKKAEQYKSIIKWAGRQYNKVFVIVTHIVTMLTSMFALLFIVRFAVLIYYNFERLIDGTYSVDYNLDDATELIWLAIASILVNLIHVVSMYRIGEYDKPAKSIFWILARPICATLSILLLIWADLDFFVYAVGVWISVVLLIKAVSLNKEVNKESGIRADMERLDEYYREHPEEEVDDWKKMLGQEKMDGIINPATGRVDTEKLMDELMGKEYMNKYKKSLGKK